ncbi:hypothetical protein [Alteromonas stellipolaris]|uniref:DUF2335 domain-containing protein n=1 Tax=Alteromonas stellipolaris TaxID=233316 RepID=A0AAW7YUC2_9ALTE|nr:hypothetical protein [Alteromonas stellipolaris]MDO6575950.1 hypothetical protein [Alteromonas stellipolaris]
MSDKGNNLPEAMEHMADDLGLDKGALTNFDIGSVFKQGTNSALFLTRISHVYSENTNQQHKIEKLEEELTSVKGELEEEKAKNNALQKTEATLRLRYEHLASTGQHSVLSTTLFSLGSIAIGVTGSYINANQIPNAIIAGVIGIGMSIFAATLIISKKPKEDL